jgi:phosphopantothenoylcysteine decarboxylase/phosphopantothenate--cysteine ligase
MAPAMNHVMWHHKATQTNVKILQTQGVQIIAPEYGLQACGEVGEGRMASSEKICQRILDELSAPAVQILLGLNVVITAGATREPLDPVRYLTNRSSGKMGYNLATAAQKAGANVTLISGISALPSPLNCHFVSVETAEEMLDAVFVNIKNCDIFIAAAAVADYRPAFNAPEKIKKNAEQLLLKLERNPDILASVADLESPPFTVGFAAETHNLEQHAREKLARKKINMVAANWVGGEKGGFERDENALEVFWKEGRYSLPMTDKAELARQLIDLIGKRFHGCVD